jgi:hypothetical protein
VPAPTAELQVPVAQVLPGSQQGWPVPPQATQDGGAPPGGSMHVVPDFEQNSVPPQQGCPTPPHAAAPLTQEPVSVQVPVFPPPQAVPPAMHTLSLFTHRPVLQTLPRQAGWFIPPHVVQVPLPPPMHETVAS